MSAVTDTTDHRWESVELENPSPHIGLLCRELGISPLLARLLVIRNLHDPFAAEQFLNPRPEHCHDPFLMRDMHRAVERLQHALRRQEQVVVFGDYDVDGTAGAVLVYRYLKRIGMRAHYLIPERLSNGYGLTKPALLEMARRRTRVVVTVDNGSTAVEEAQTAQDCGIDLLITDHHQLGDVRPPVYALVNPGQPGCAYPFKGLCGTAVAYKLIQALDQSLTQQGHWEQTSYLRPEVVRDLDLVALATLADRMPLLGENRILVRAGLERLNPCERPGLQVLMSACGVRGTATASLISHRLIPKLNSVGRMNEPQLAARLLLAHSLMEARPLVKKLMAMNDKRRRVEQEVFRSALAQAADQMHLPALILTQTDWHPGVMGSVASRVASHLGKTTFMLTRAPNTAEQQSSPQELTVGSARVVGDLNLCVLLSEFTDLLERFGGHPAAVGMSLESRNLERFRKRFQETVREASTPTMASAPALPAVEAWLQPRELHPKITRDLLRMSPFGTENPEPILGIRHASPQRPTVFGQQHLKFELEDSGAPLEVIAWNHAEWFPQPQHAYDLVVTPQLHIRHSGASKVQLRALDMYPSVAPRRSPQSRH